MADSRDVHQLFAVYNSVYDSPLSDADTPEVYRPFKFCYSGWARIPGQRLDALENLQSHGRIE